MNPSIKIVAIFLRILIRCGGQDPKVSSPLEIGLIAAYDRKMTDADVDRVWSFIHTLPDYFVVAQDKVRFAVVTYDRNGSTRTFGHLMLRFRDCNDDEMRSLSRPNFKAGWPNLGGAMDMLQGENHWAEARLLQVAPKLVIIVALGYNESLTSKKGDGSSHRSNVYEAALRLRETFQCIVYVTYLRTWDSTDLVNFARIAGNASQVFNLNNFAELVNHISRYVCRYNETCRFGNKAQSTCVNDWFSTTYPCANPKPTSTPTLRCTDLRQCQDVCDNLLQISPTPPEYKHLVENCVGGPSRTTTRKSTTIRQNTMLDKETTVEKASTVGEVSTMDENTMISEEATTEKSTDLTMVIVAVVLVAVGLVIFVVIVILVVRHRRRARESALKSPPIKKLAPPIKKMAPPIPKKLSKPVPGGKSVGVGVVRIGKEESVAADLGEAHHLTKPKASEKEKSAKMALEKGKSTKASEKGKFKGK